MADKNKKKQLTEEIDKFLEENEKDNENKISLQLGNFLKDLKAVLSTGEENNSKQFEQSKLLTQEQTEVLEKMANGIDLMLEDSQNARKKPQEVLVKNQKDFPTEIEVNNFPKSDAPLVVKAIESLVARFKTAITAFIGNQTPKEAIPVRLVDKSGKAFYDAAMNVQYGAGGDFENQSKLLQDIGGNQNPLDKYKIANKDDDGTPNYYGFTDKDGNWYILKETISAGADTYRYIKGSSDFPTNWTGRAGLSYDYFENVF